MGLRCLIGHEYGEPQTSRDRTQRGNEVVVTVREYRECTRCGHRRIISENKEVTADAPDASSDEPTAEAAWSTEPDAADEDQATVDAFARSPSGSAAGAHDEPITAAEDDGIILEDEPDAPRRPRGEWPEADLGGAEGDASAEPEPWPDEAADPTPTEPEPPEPPGPDDDPLDAGPEPTAEPSEAAGPADGPATDETDEIIEAAESPAEPDRTPPRPDNRDTEFVCPDCGETWPTRNASLRPGDICPECRRGYLDERVVQ